MSSQRISEYCKYTKIKGCQPSSSTSPFPCPANDSTLPSAFDTLPFLIDVCLQGKVVRCFHQVLSRLAGRRRERAGCSSAASEWDDKTTVPMCHGAGYKTRLLFTDHTSTLNHLTPGSSRACWEDAIPRKMDLSDLINVHINFPGIDLGTCLRSRFQFT